jgi:predicted molibdopterin-dependent oxidoreductase YjgC
MIDNTEEKAENLSIEIPRALFEEAGIPADGELEIYSRDGKIVIRVQITDEYICDEDCEYCPCLK